MTDLFIATGNSFARLTQTGEGWRLSTGLHGKGVRAIAVDPADPKNLYTGSSSSGLWKSTDRGQTWEELSALREIPSAPTWSFPPRPWTSHVRWIAPNPQDPDLLLAGIELGGIMFTDDGGDTWRDHPAGAVKDVHELAWHPTEAARAYVAGGGGAAWSTDSAQTWSRSDEGRSHHYVWALAVDPENPDQWFVSAANGPSAAHAGTYGGNHNTDTQIYRWRGAGPWEPLTSLDKSKTAMPYALSMTNGRLFAGLADGQLFVSDNYGDTWDRISPAGDPINSISALIAV